MKITINKIGSIIPVLTLISILLLSVSLASAAEDYPTLSNRFAGDVTLNGKPAPVGTIINAYIGDDFRGSVTVETAGEYVWLGVEGSSSDNDVAITFTVGGVTADPTTATWQEANNPQTFGLTATGTPVASSGSSSPSDRSRGDGVLPPSNGGAVDDTGDTDGTVTSSVPDDGATAEPSTEATTTATDESGAGSEEETGTFPWVVLVLAGLAVVAIVAYSMRK